MYQAGRAMGHVSCDPIKSIPDSYTIVFGGKEIHVIFMYKYSYHVFL